MKVRTVLFLVEAAIKLWRMNQMYKRSMNMAKTIGLGIAAATAVAAVAGVSSGKKRHKTGMNIKKTAGKAVHTVGALIGDVEKMLR